MSIFNKIANLQYKSTTGGLPMWVFFVAFIVFTLVAKFNKYKDDSGDEKQMGWGMALLAGFFISLVLFLGDRFRKAMFGARTRLYKREGFSDPRGNAFQTQEMSNLSAQISGLRNPGAP
jgi:hypothetical protein